MQADIPEFLLDMSKQMTEQPNRATAHPFWQVRCKRYVVTSDGYNDHHWVLQDDESGEVYRSDTQNLIVAAEYFSEHHPDWFSAQIVEIKDDKPFAGQSDLEIFAESFDFDWGDLPNNVNKLSVQEIEEVVTTHLTEADALWFIKRKQHDYPKLYTYVESAYWSPQLKQLQDWIISLSSK